MTNPSEDKENAADPFSLWPEASSDHRCRSHTPPCEYSRAERRLKIVAADWSVEVEDLPREIEAGDEFALHRAAVDLAQADAAGGDFSFGESASSGDGNCRP